MKCRRAKQLVFDFLDKVIADSDRISLENHLNECESCETFTSQVSRSLDLLHHAPEETPSDNFNWKVRLKIAHEKNRMSDAFTAQTNLFKTWNLRFSMSAISSLVLILACGYFLWSSGWMADLRANGGSAPDRFAHVAKTQTVAQPNGSANPSAGSYTLRRGLTTPVSNRPGFDDSFTLPPGPIDEHQYDFVIDDSTPGSIAPDSLVMLRLRSVPLRHRLNQLEGQVQLLQKYLRECEGGYKD